MTTNATPPIKRPSAVTTILVATAIVGIIDGTDAVVFHGLRGVSAARIFRYISTSLLGKDGAAAAGNYAVALGVVLHFCVALGLSTGYYLLSAKWPGMRPRWVVSGAVYGLLTYVIMNYGILPLTRVPGAGFGVPPWPILTNNVLAHVFCVGLPMAYVTWRLTRTASVATEGARLGVTANTP